MDILSVKALEIPAVKLVEYERYRDERGYFTETYRRSDLSGELNDAGVPFSEAVQLNESYSRGQVVRGLHFQWDPPMGKLVRPVVGEFVDLALDIRVGSPTYGKLVGAVLTSDPDGGTGRWMWVPPGFAHGVAFESEGVVEYACTGEYNPDGESGISPLAPDLDWSLVEEEAREAAQRVLEGDPVMTAKDREAHTVSEWKEDPRSANFVYSGETE